MRNATLLALSLIVCFSAFLFAGTHGKIAGRVTDAENGQPLPGVDVMIEGTTMGAATNADGYYSILNVPPGTFTIRFSIIGYTKTNVKDVRVVIDLTTTVNAELHSTTLVAGEIVVTAQRPIVTKDVSASQFNIQTKNVETMPVARTTQAIKRR